MGAFRLRDRVVCPTGRAYGAAGQPGRAGEIIRTSTSIPGTVVVLWDVHDPLPSTTVRADLLAHEPAPAHGLSHDVPRATMVVSRGRPAPTPSHGRKATMSEDTAPAEHTPFSRFAGTLAAQLRDQYGAENVDVISEDSDRIIIGLLVADTDGSQTPVSLVANITE